MRLLFHDIAMPVGAVNSKTLGNSSFTAFIMYGAPLWHVPRANRFFGGMGKRGLLCL